MTMASNARVLRALLRTDFNTFVEKTFARLALAREIRSRLPHGTTLAKRAETALTTAALNRAIEGVGVAWILRSLAFRDVARGTLADLSGRLPSAAIEIAACRLRRSEPAPP